MTCFLFGIVTAFYPKGTEQECPGFVEAYMRVIGRLDTNDGSRLVKGSRGSLQVACAAPSLAALLCSRPAPPHKNTRLADSESLLTCCDGLARQARSYRLAYGSFKKSGFPNGPNLL